MNLKDQRELEVARQKLDMLEESYHAAKQEPGVDRHIQEVELRSLKQLINQLKEEIARFKGRAAVRASVR